jgi:hypothetical protein
VCRNNDKYYVCRRSCGQGEKESRCDYDCDYHMSCDVSYDVAKKLCKTEREKALNESASPSLLTPFFHVVSETRRTEEPPVTML